MTDKNCLSFWFPKIRDAGLPVPRTEIIKMQVPIYEMFGVPKPPCWYAFFGDLRSACLRVGLSCFLRTGHGSGKHQWDDTCCIRAVDGLASHVAALIEWSAMVDILGLPADVWAVREMLPVEPLAHLPRYRNMPVVREWRCFVLDRHVQCLHPYWPKGALAGGMTTHEGLDDLYRRLQQITPAEWDLCQDLALKACEAVGGGWWSVDLLCTKEGFYVTDMAEGERSYHWEDCPNR